MADLCQSGSPRWGVTLTDTAKLKPGLLIVGAGGHGRSVAEAVLMADTFALVGFLDDGAYAEGAQVWGWPVLGAANGFETYKLQATHAI